jgi:putative ATPase
MQKKDPVNGEKRMDLFEYAKSKTLDRESPLASRLRPTKLEEVVGQEHIVGKDKLLYRAIKADKLTSVIFYGPPGTGKTTLAKVIANTTSANFTQINATVAGKKDMEQVVHEAQDSLGMYGRKTILFIDEIHRFNKGQQDYLLPFVEDGTIILIGATTENPYFEVNGALLSRSIIFELHSLSIEDIKILIRRAVYDEEKGMGSYDAEIDEDALDFLADMAGGDARSALNAVELGILTTPRSTDGKIHLTLEVASECIQKRVVRYDKNGDNHYDIISAFIKSMRGSDPDAAVYYLAKMLYAGEDVKFIARRIMILASEDIGNADPQAICVAAAAAQEVERVGMPESQIILAQAAAYMACAPKSNSSVEAIYAAMRSVKKTKTTVPVHLQDAHYGGHEKLGHGIGYQYAHDFPNHYVKQQYLPDEIQGEHFYEISEMGYEKVMKERMERIRREVGES